MPVLPQQKLLLSLWAGLTTLIDCMHNTTTPTVPSIFSFGPSKIPLTDLHSTVLSSRNLETKRALFLPVKLQRARQEINAWAADDAAGACACVCIAERARATAPSDEILTLLSSDSWPIHEEQYTHSPELQRLRNGVPSQ